MNLEFEKASLQGTNQQSEESSFYTKDNRKEDENRPLKGRGQQQTKQEPGNRQDSKPAIECYYCRKQGHY